MRPFSFDKCLKRTTGFGLEYAFELGSRVRTVGLARVCMRFRCFRELPLSRRWFLVCAKGASAMAAKFSRLMSNPEFMATGPVARAGPTSKAPTRLPATKRDSGYADPRSIPTDQSILMFLSIALFPHGR